MDWKPRAFRPPGPNTGRPDNVIGALVRKSRQVIKDPVLRKWLIGRMLGENPPTPAFQAHRPPYLAPSSGARPAPSSSHNRNDQRQSDPPITLPLLTLPLAGMDLPIEPTTVSGLFRKSFTDTETLLSLQRFAWLPLLEYKIDPAWVEALWAAWVAAHGTPDDGWAWHPYTAAERAINILDYGRTNGLPGDRGETAAILGRHAHVIADGLEYGGEHNTSNHLANNGRGLYRLGLALDSAMDLNWAADMGRDILLNEAERVFLASGVLREGSSHYHLLYTQRYIDVYLAARAQGRPEANDFRAIAERALGVLPHLLMPGGFPLIGDISPDSPPSYLSGLLAHDAVGWAASLGEDDLAHVGEMKESAQRSATDTLQGDGWLRHDHGPWSALWYVSPQGWPPMPGHAHQDCGSFELHFGTTRVIVDPGRGSYENNAGAAAYCSAEAHNLLTIDSAAPYPDNRPYYDDRFRTRTCSEAPRTEVTPGAVTLHMDGFSRLKSTGTVTRRWRFEDNRVVIADQVAGNHRARLDRHLHVCHPLSRDGAAVVVEADGRRFKIAGSDTAPTITPTEIWRQYGKSHPGSRLSFTDTAGLPWSGELSIEAL